MPVVLVHGVPDTFRVWDGVRAELDRSDVTALALPGFGADLPAGFGATKEEYVDWIIARLEEGREPVHLVGHDWGAILTARVASLRPDLVRSWAGSDGPVNADYVWHEWAKIWQTPVLGERWMADLQPASFAAQLEAFSVPAGLALETAERLDDTYKDCILRLYRSAVSVGAEWEPGLAGITAPSLVLWGVDDPATPVVFADRLGESIEGARVLKLDAGHWTPLEQPGQIATALQEHWRTADRDAPASNT